MGPTIVRELRLGPGSRLFPELVEVPGFGSGVVTLLLYFRRRSLWYVANSESCL